jgi:hypothetical protein
MIAALEVKHHIITLEIAQKGKFKIPKEFIVDSCTSYKLVEVFKRFRQYDILFGYCS